MFKKFAAAVVAFVATVPLASAAVWYGPGFGGPVGGGGFYGGYHSSYYHYSAPAQTYRPPAVTYRRVPVYMVVPRPKPVVIVQQPAPQIIVQQPAPQIIHQAAPDPCACNN